jgi:hypothetical protein
MRSLRSKLLTLILLLAVFAPTLQAQVAPAKTPGSMAPFGQEVRFAADVQKFIEADKTSPPPVGGIEFIGSSIFRQWTTVAQDMAPLPAFNRAYGGSHTWEMNAWLDKVVLPYKPAIIVYYCGSNDIQAGVDQTPEEIFARVKEFEVRVHDALPNTRIVFFSINRAMDQRNRWDVVDRTNELVKQWAYRTPNFDYVESNTALFDANDEPIVAHFKPDGRHFNPSAYVEFTKILKPVLQKAMAEIRAQDATNN